MHDAWFTNTALNGTGIKDDKVIEIANKAGLKGKELLDCGKAGTYNSEISADSAAAAAAGISGTPGFVVGKIDADGNVTGDLISGAYPFDEFDKAITKYL
jgi:predicted DsbA family dithiol-disulfide isomerase